ncbi:MAG: PASTA domain-containing protein [Rectinemataceae bacterium]|nr:PASTA domain-containing protein [Rectinemataceae bacterium]
MKKKIFESGRKIGKAGLKIGKAVGDLGSRIGEKMPGLPLDPKHFGSWTLEQYRIFTYFLLSLMALMVVVGTGVFFLALRGTEQTLVPDVRGIELPEAMVKLQERELYPRLSLRFTDNPADRNQVLEQNPAAGTIVKAGRRVNLTVSRGAVIDRIEDFTGKNLDETKIHFQALFTSTRALVTVREPVVYVYDKSEAGTILQQKPQAGTEISGPVELEFVVSKGPEKARIQVPAFGNLSLSNAVAAAAKSPVAVDFAVRPAQVGEKAGTVTGQDPAAGGEMDSGGRLSVTIAAPDSQKGMVAGLFVHELPAYPYAVPVTLTAVKPSGERTILASLKHPGGKFTIPFFLPENSVLILSVLDKETAKAEIR